MTSSRDADSDVALAQLDITTMLRKGLLDNDGDAYRDLFGTGAVVLDRLHVIPPVTDLSR